MSHARDCGRLTTRATTKTCLLISPQGPAGTGKTFTNVGILNLWYLTQDLRWRKASAMALHDCKASLGGAQRLAEKDVRSEIWELLKGGRLGLAAPRPLAGATRS